MYAVIRAGGKQYRVSPGDVLKIEKSVAGEQGIDFEVLAVSGEEGKIVKPENAQVIGQVLGEGRADKILVFHFKRKKQYKKLNGHRQGFHPGPHCRNQLRRAEVFCSGTAGQSGERRRRPRPLPRRAGAPRRQQNPANEASSSGVAEVGSAAQRGRGGAHES